MLRALFAKQQNTYSTEIIDILRLIRSENVGPRTFFSLVKMFGNPKAAVVNIEEISLRGGLSKPIKPYSYQDVEKELELLTKYEAHLISYTDPLYSSLLTQIFDFPPILTYKGNIELLNHPKLISIVGSRAASINGQRLASMFAKELKDEGYVIVSGLARGIDAAAHTVVPDKTIAVIAGGIDNIYPPENKKLYEQIAKEGLIISELPIGTKPLAQHFPQRNRLISGISLGVIIVEASLNSGSLITAKTALEQNREVFAVPGFPLDPRYQGTNKLIKEGAYIVESIQDITTNLRDYKNLQKSFEFEEENANSNKFDMMMPPMAITNFMRKSVTTLLSANPTPLEYLIKSTNLSLQIIQMIIVELELAGKVIRLPGNQVVLIY